MSGGRSVILESSAATFLTGQLCTTLVPAPTPDGTAPFIVDLSAYPALSADQRALLEAPSQDGMLRLFGTPSLVTPSEPVPDLLDVSPEEYEAWVERSQGEYVTAQRDRLLLNFQPCTVYNLRDEFHVLPEIFREAMVDFRNDPNVHFYVDMTLTEDGRTIPEVHFLRMSPQELTADTDRLIVLNTSETSSEEDGGLGDSAGPLAAAGFLATRSPRFNGNGRRPVSLNPGNVPNGMRIPIGIGGAVAMYAFVDWTLSDIPQDSPFRAPMMIAESALLYQGAYYASEFSVPASAWLAERGFLPFRFQNGFIGRPDWRGIGRGMPNLFVTQYGATALYDAVGLPAGSMENQLASIGTSVGVVYYGAPYVAAHFPRFATGFTATRIPAVSNVLGRALVVLWITDGILQIAKEIDGSGDDPDGQLAQMAWDHDLYDRWWVFGSIFNVPKAVLYGVSDSMESQYDERHRAIIGGWIDGADQFARSIDDYLVGQANASLREGPDGNLEIDWTVLENGIRENFSSLGDGAADTYRLINLLDNSVWVHNPDYGVKINRAAEMTQLIASDGSVPDRDRLRRRVVERALGESRYQLATAMGERGLDRPVPQSRLTLAQRTFLYAPETRAMMRRVQFWQTLQRQLGS